jgi:hypothetical protein
MSKSFGCGVVASAFVLSGALGFSPAFAKDVKFPDYKAYDQAGPSDLTAKWAGAPQGWGGLVTPFVGVELGAVGSNANFNVDPPFNVSGVTGVGGFNFGFWVNPSDGKLRFGPRVGFLWGFGDNSISNPAASPSFSYKVENSWIAFYEAQAEWCGDWWSERSKVTFSLGAATVNRTITATMENVQQNSEFPFSVGHSSTGITASVGFGFPVTGQWDAMAQFRYINDRSTTFNIPGPVQVGGDLYIGTLGMTYHFGKFGF